MQLNECHGVTDYGDPVCYFLQRIPNPSVDWQIALVGHFLWVICITVKLGNKGSFYKELIGINEPFPVTNLPFTSYE